MSQNCANRDPLSLSGRALRAGIANRAENVFDRGHRLVRRDTNRWILPSHQHCALAGVRVGAVLHPAVLFAFADGAGLLQHGDRPSAKRADRRAPLRLPCRVADHPVAHFRRRISPASNSASCFRQYSDGCPPSMRVMARAFLTLLALASRSNWIFLLAGRHDLQRPVWNRPLQRLGVVPRACSQAPCSTDEGYRKRSKNASKR
jgi:hypothetical protein